jgi:transcriptional regulator with XRE-family HTH domain
MISQRMLILGKAIRAARTEKGWSLEKLATRSGLNIDYISRLERGLVNASVATIETIAESMKSDFSVTFAGKPEPKDNRLV